MNGLLRRLAIGLLAMVAGAFAAGFVAADANALVGALVGGVFGFAAVVVFDGLRGWRLLRWLRGA